MRAARAGDTSGASDAAAPREVEVAAERKGGERATGAASTEAQRRLKHDAEIDREYTTPERVRALDEESPTGRPEDEPGTSPRK